jgi:MYXO-CTERM domain-containing protein
MLAAMACAALCGYVHADTVADSVNANQSADNNAYWGSYDVGWLYTPSFSYNLSGVLTMFSIPVGTSIENRDVTVVLYQGTTPALGGTLLGSFQFDSSTAEGTFGGGDFGSPISLSAGQQYFVGFKNVGPINANPNANTNAIGVNFTGNPNATFLSNHFFDDTRDASCANTTDFACEGNDTGPSVVLGEPILEFLRPNVATTPEPASGALLGGAILALLGIRRRRV